MKRIYKIGLWLACAIAGPVAHGQTDSLMAMLEATGSPKNEIVTATFKATRIINSSSVENLAAGVLDFRILHRFGAVNQGAENFYGIDNATTRLGLDYGVTRWLMVGVGHAVLNKENDAFVKVKLLRQKEKGMPVSVGYYSAASIQTFKAPTLDPGQTYFFSNRLCYTNQLLIARKFSDRLSLQLMPTIMHQNLVDSSKYDNDILTIGIGGRIKVSKRIAVTGEYFPRLTGTQNNAGSNKTYNSLSLGVDIETGGHVFQLFFTNSHGITERAYLSQTTDSWTKGALHFGFNISRVFTIVKPKEFR